MADLAQSAVSVNVRYKTVAAYDGIRKKVDATLTLTGHGGNTNKIPASLFGMSRIEAVHSARSSTLQYVSAPSLDGSYLTLCLVQGATGAPADITDTVRLVVEGIEKLM